MTTNALMELADRLLAAETVERQESENFRTRSTGYKEHTERADLLAEARLALRTAAAEGGPDGSTVCTDIPDWAIAKSYRKHVDRLDPNERGPSALVFASDVTVDASMLARSVKAEYPYNPADLARWLRIHYRNSWDEPKTRIPEIVWIYETLLHLPLSITPDQMQLTDSGAGRDGEILLQALTDPENQPSQWGTIPVSMLPERMDDSREPFPIGEPDYDDGYARGWNACLDRIDIAIAGAAGEGS